MLEFSLFRKIFLIHETFEKKLIGVVWFFDQKNGQNLKKCACQTGYFGFFNVLNWFFLFISEVSKKSSRCASGSFLLFSVCVSRFLFRTSGVIFENEVIQIGIKSQFSPPQAVGQVELYYGNKSTSPMSNFNVQLRHPEADSLLVQLSEIGPVVQISAQVKQTVSTKCMAPFSTQPHARISFTYDFSPNKYHLHFSEEFIISNNQMKLSHRIFIFYLKFFIFY